MKIGPLKVETLSNSPHILQFYDILGEREIGQIVTQSAHIKLDFSQISTNDGLGKISRDRTSVNGWIKSGSRGWLEKKVGWVTGLVMTDSEDLQVVEYITGRYYSHHTDVVRSKSRT
jgi:hypothetical protein